MATRRFGISAGDQLEGTNRVTDVVGAAVASKNIELTVDLGLVKSGGTQQLTKAEVVQALDTLHDYIIQSIWPPA